MKEYKNLIEAAKLIGVALAEVNREDGMLVTPAWKMLRHAEDRLMAQADVVLRGAEVAA